METKKILILGVPGSGKTTAMENVCEKLLQSGDLEQGTLIIKSRKIQLFSYPHYKRWKLMRHSLFKSISGAVIFINSTTDLSKTDEKLIIHMKKKNIPYVIFANKQDLTDKKVKIDLTDAPVIPTNAKDKKSIIKALIILLETISPYQEYVKNHPYIEVVKIKNHSK